MAAIEDVDKLMNQAYELLDSFQCEEALQVGEKLKTLGYSGAFEVMALAYQTLGETDKAIAVLNDGLEKVPHVWVLWHLLGNLLSDKGEYTEAQHAYDMALACPGVNKPWVHYNIAVLLGRQAKFEDALDRSLLVTGDDLGLARRTLTASLLNSLERHDEAITVAEEIISQVSAATDASDEDIRSMGTAYAELSRGLWEGRMDRQGATECANKALALNKSDWLALRMLRELKARNSDNSSWYKIVVEGRWHEPFEGEKVAPGFFSSYELVADSPELCLEMIKEIEPEEVRDSLKLEQVEQLESCPGEPQGVYWRSGYAFFSTRKKTRKRAGKDK
jgi:tetratricopeptide (TPR) repeat protein